MSIVILKFSLLAISVLSTFIVLFCAMAFFDNRDRQLELKNKINMRRVIEHTKRKPFDPELEFKGSFNSEEEV